MDSEPAHIGNPALLTKPLTGLFCSQKCPAELILKGYDLARELREAQAGVIGGFHAGVEKDLLTILLRGKGPVVVGVARRLENYRVPEAWKAALEAGRLTLVAPDFGADETRITKETAVRRNALVVELAARVVFIYAHPGGRTEQLCRESLAMGKAVFAVESEWNRRLFEMGAVAISPHPNPSPNQNWERGVQM